MSICLVQAFSEKFLAYWIAFTLSVKITGNVLLNPKFLVFSKILDNHTISFAVSDKAIYSASIVESAIHFCLLQCQEIGNPLTNTRKPDKDFLSVQFVPQLASKYAQIPSSLADDKLIQKSFV